MPKQERFKTKYPGVFYVMASRKGGKPNQTERLYYIRFKKDGKLIEEPAGRQYADDMTAAKAANKRANKIQGKEPTRREKRQAALDAEKAKTKAWTIDRLWREYKKGRKPGKSLKIDEGRYKLYIKEPFSDKEPSQILPLDVERLKRRLLKTKSPQTVKHTLNLLTWVVNFGVKQGLCPGLTFHVQKPTVDNMKTEDLSQEQLKRLLETINNDQHPIAGNLMRLALCSGMRRSEMFKLQWNHIDFNRGFITLVDTKGGRDEQIPMNQVARDLLKSIPKTKGSPYVFPGRDGRQLVDINKALTEIKTKASLPKNFRSLHGLRHVFASQLASSGEVDMYVLQRLLTHKDPRMTQRYSHLRDQALKQASELAGDIVKGITTENKQETKIVNLEK